MARKVTPGQKAAGRAVRNQRGVQHLTQKELAQESGVSRRTIVDFELGHRWPLPDNLGDLERALGWESGYLSEFAARYDTEEGSGDDDGEQAILALPYLLEGDRKLFLKVYRMRREDDAALRLVELERMRAGAAQLPDKEMRERIVADFDRQIRDLKLRGYDATPIDA